jgi:hypothetical protein
LSMLTLTGSETDQVTSSNCDAAVEHPEAILLAKAANCFPFGRC